MTIREYLLLMTCGSVIASIGWIIILLRVDPNEAISTGHLLFYLTGFTALTGAITALLTALRKAAHEHRAAERIMISSLRHGIVLGSLITVSLFLSSLNSFSIPAFLILCLFAGIIEFIFSSKKTDLQPPQ
ncbi:MAG: hypothetical protein O3B64_01225 [bacterium]|nr:hypothetical protein [bacterium]